MPKLAPQTLRRLLACALPVCALSLLAQRLVLAQRPSNALPPSSRPAPTDEYYRGEAPYPTATPAGTPIATPTLGGNPYNGSGSYDPGPGTPTPDGTPQATPTSTPTPDGTPQAYAEEGTLEGFLAGEAGSLSMQLSQVRRGWKSLRIVRDASGSSSSSGSSGAGASTSAASSESDPFYRAMLEKFGGSPDVFLTRGRTLKLNGEDHLLVYRAQFPTRAQSLKWFNSHRAQFTSPGATDPSAAQAKRMVRDFLDTVPLRASLVNTRHVAAMETIEPFDFASRLSAFGSTIDAEVGHGGKASEPSTPIEPSRPPSASIIPPMQVPNRTPAPRPRTPRALEEPRVVPVPDAVAQAASTEPLKRLFAAVQRYRADNADVLPPMEDLAQAQAALSIYLSGGESWRDPVSGRFFLPNARLSQRRMVHLKPFASSLILFYSEADSGGQRMVLRLDGIIRRASASEWDKLTGSAGVQ